MQRMDMSAQSWLDSQETMAALVKRHKELPAGELELALRRHCGSRWCVLEAAAEGLSYLHHYFEQPILHRYC